MKQISYDERDPISPDQRARMRQLQEHNNHIDPCTGIEGIIKKVIAWHHQRNLIEGSSDKDQLLKLLEEMAELSDSIVNSRDIKDDIGDMLVVMLNICERNGIRLHDCLLVAYNDIKDRKGKMVDGIFVKEDC